MRRTLAMRVYIAAYAVLLGLLAYLVLSVAEVVPQLAEREGNVSLGFVLVFSTIFGLLYTAVIVAAALGAMRHGGGGSGLQALFRRSSSSVRT